MKVWGQFTMFCTKISLVYVYVFSGEVFSVKFPANDCVELQI